MQTGWKDRLEQWAPPPPAEVWARLSEQLDATEAETLRQRLKHFSAAPPPDTWAKIAAHLEPAAKTPVIRLAPRNKWLRVAGVAASVLCAVFLYRQYQLSPLPVATSPQGVQQQTVLPMPQTNLPTAVAKQANRIIAAVRPVRKQTTTPAPQIPLPRVALAPLPVATSDFSPTTTWPDALQSGVEINAAAYPDRYMVMAVGDDAAVRVPRKLYDLYQCGQQPVVSNCSRLMRRLQRQTAKPSRLAHADFAGLLELLRAVER